MYNQHTLVGNLKPTEQPLPNGVTGVCHTLVTSARRRISGTTSYQKISTQHLVWVTKPYLINYAKSLPEGILVLCEGPVEEMTLQDENGRPTVHRYINAQVLQSLQTKGIPVRNASEEASEHCSLPAEFTSPTGRSNASRIRCMQTHAKTGLPVKAPQE